MLIDDLLEELSNEGVPAYKQFRDASETYKSGASSSLRSAQRFVLSPQIVHAATELATPKVIERMADYLFLPAELTWLEWTDEIGLFGGGRVGVMLQSGTPGDIYAGAATGYRRPLSLLWNWIADFDLKNGQTYIRNSHGYEFADDRLQEAELKRDHSERMAWVWTAIAFINTPRVSEQRPADLSRLNKRRGTRPPLLSYKDVHLTVDAALSRPNMANGGCTTGERPRHHVRTHLRLRNGKVQIVKPHWRGNRDKGLVLQRHVVRTSDDNRGTWEGGPLPSPTILKV